LQHFPELHPVTPIQTSNGEVAYEVQANELFGVQVADRCKPIAFVFLERVPEGWPEMVPASRSLVQEYVQNGVERLPKELSEVSATRQTMIDALSGLSCWIYRYSGSPRAGADYLSNFFESMR
jgi:hypothetical protein